MTGQILLQSPNSGALTNPIIFKGAITVAADFPTAALVHTGWFYVINANVTDDDETKTNTGKSFSIGDEIVWDGSSWAEWGTTKNETVNIAITYAVGLG